jgi:4-hydroxybenzoyl-CoA reductase alpha subunit
MTYQNDKVFDVGSAEAREAAAHYRHEQLRRDRDQDFNIVGQRLPMVDARAKVTGQGLYTDDMKLPGMLHCRLLRSAHPHARIVDLKTDEVLAMPGVVAVATADDAPTTFGVLPISKDEPTFAKGKAVHIGQPVAALAAESLEEADAAVRAWARAVEYETLLDFLTSKDSAREVRENEERIHAWGKRKDNVQKQVEQEFGPVDEGFAQAQVVREANFVFPGVTHAFTEPHATIAHFTGDGRLTVYSAQQVPHYLHMVLAEVLGMDMHRIRVVKPMVGGGFGGKSDPFPHEVAVAVLSRKTGRPVKIRFDREEVFLSNHGRHPTHTGIRLAVDKTGKILALDLDALIDGGAFGSFGVVTTYYNGVLSHGPYRLPAFRYRGRRTYTNKPPSGAMRGHGSVNSRHAFEVLLDEAAHELGMDPMDLRMGNLLPEHTTTINGFRITSNGIRQCLERVREASGWDERYGKLPYGRGLGVGCGFYISGSALQIHKSRLPQSTVHIKIDVDGGITVHTGAADIGQGSDTMVAQCVAEVLAVDMSRIRVKATDTDLAPVDLGSYSSRVTFMNGNAARRAAEQIRDMLLDAAARVTGYARELFVMRDGLVLNTHWPEHSLDFNEALREALADRGALIATGSYQSPPMGMTFKGAGAGLSPTYSFSAFVCELEVDPDTGFVRPLHVWAAHDCGRALNPVAVEGQIEGSVHMGLGQALMEDMDYLGGSLRNANLLDYKCIDPVFTPEIDVLIVESIDPEGPFGAKECGEGGLAPILPAVANAVFDAVGVRIHRLPLTPDVVLRALQRKRRSEDRERQRVAQAAGGKR